MTTFLVILAVLILAGAATFVVALARKGRRAAADNLALGPGLTTTAPKEWAGSHSPEAKLHRRLRAAARSVGAVAAETAASIEQKVALEQQIVAVDSQLVAAAAVPAAQRTEPLARIEALVSAIEASTASFLLSGTETGWLEQTQIEVDGTMPAAGSVQPIAPVAPPLRPAVVPRPEETA